MARARRRRVAPKKTPSPVMLRAVAVSEDGASLVLARRAGARSGGFRLPIDRALVEQLEQARDVLHPPPAEPKLRRRIAPPAESKLSPKEIQIFLRQGRSAASVARRAGVSVEWIERFEVPIIAERFMVAARARAATMHRPRRGAAALPLGEAVRANLKRRRIRMDDEVFESSWDAVRHPRRGTWTVTFSFASRGRPVSVEWEYHPESGEAHALGRLAAELGWVAPSRRSS